MIKINTYEQTLPVEKKKLKLKPQVKEFINNALMYMTLAVILLGLVFVVIEMIDRSKNHEAFENAETTEIVVHKGDTVWTIADSLEFEDVEIREIVYTISELNDIDNAEIYAGQVLIVPVPEK
jgi:nucleoid-associated protein YgaU